MIKRIEFTLNLDDPGEAAIYRALQIPLTHRRAGAVIRQALDVYLFGTPGRSTTSRAVTPVPVMPAPIDEERTEHIVEQSASMFGF
jgi:hypothetical protein